MPENYKFLVEIHSWSGHGICALSNKLHIVRAIRNNVSQLHTTDYNVPGSDIPYKLHINRILMINLANRIFFRPKSGHFVCFESSAIRKVWWTKMTPFSNWFKLCPLNEMCFKDNITSLIQAIMFTHTCLQDEKRRIIHVPSYLITEHLGGNCFKDNTH